jgi:DNA-binding NarL/FixJ family response regulator
MVVDAIRVLVVDDHAVVREGLRSFLDLQDGIEIAGEAGDGREAVEAAERLQPDVVLMDLVMPGVDGLEAMRLLRARVPDARVIVLTSFLDDDKLLPALRAGAAGYLLKNAKPKELTDAVRSAHAGEAVIDPVVAARLVEVLGRDGGGDDPLASLTPREREVLALIGHGYANKRIALELGVSDKTVKTHVGHLIAKLGVDDRTQAAVIAVRAGLLDQRS